MTKERDVSQQFLTYRDCARSSWNCLFQAAVSPGARMSFDDSEAWQHYNELLFSRLVLAPVGKLGAARDSRNFQIPRRKSLDFFRIRIDKETPTPISIENPRAGDGTHYWDHPVKTLKDGEMWACFVDFFDWDEQVMRDFDYVLVRIEASGAFPQLVGKLALIETYYCSFFLISEGPV